MMSSVTQKCGIKELYQGSTKTKNALRNIKGTSSYSNFIKDFLFIILSTKSEWKDENVKLTSTVLKDH